MRVTKAIAGLFATCALAIGVMAAGVLVQPAYAADTSLAAGACAVEATDLQSQATAYDIWVGDRQVTSANAGNVYGDGSVKYNAKTHTLTLNNATITTAYVLDRYGDNKDYYGLYLRDEPGVYNLVLKGNSKIIVPDGGFWNIGICGSAALKLTISGSGSLTVKAGKGTYVGWGISASSVYIKDSAKVTSNGSDMTGKKPGEYTSYGVNAEVVTLYDNSKLIASGQTQALRHGAGFPQEYTPLVKAGASASSIKVNKKKPAQSVYTKYKYISISNAKGKANTPDPKPKDSTESAKTPSKVKMTSLTSSSGCYVAQWNLLAKNVTNYEIQSAMDKSFKTDFYSHITSSDRVSKFTMTNLKSGTRYVRIRALNKVGSKTYYGAWSAVRSVRV